jgi:MATE family multidrug resistance protein
MPAFGVTSAGAILAGEAIGRRAHDEVWPTVKLTLAITGGWMLAVGLLYVVVPTFWIGLFEPGDAADRTLVDVGSRMLVLAAFWQLFDAAGMTFSEALRAAGDTAWCMAARLVLAWIVFTPLAWTAVLVFDGGVNTVMTTLIGYLALLSVAMAARFASGRWKAIDLVGTEAPVPSS